MRLRALLVILLASLLAGTPGLGLETRTGGSDVLGYLYGIPFLAAIGALVASWRWPRPTVWLAWIGAASAAILSALDLLGLMDGRPPVAVAVVEVVAILASAGILALTSPRLMRPA